MSSEDESVYSDEIQEIIGVVPSWTVRWGISIIFLILFSIITGSWFIKYPDIVYSRITITTQLAPINIIPRVSGKINILVNDNSKVRKNDILATMENSANQRDITLLTKEILKLKSVFAHDFNINDLELAKGLQVGELQTSYLALLNNIQNYIFSQKIDLYSKQLISIKNKIEQYKIINYQIETQKKTKSEELKLVEKKLQIEIKLLQQKVNAEADVDRAKLVYLQAKHALELQAMSITNNDIIISQLNAQLIELNLSKVQNQDKQKNDILSTYSQLESQLKAWQQEYLITAPIDGTVSINKFLTSNQYVTPPNEVITIVPNIQQNVYGQVIMPVNGSGKVNIGQRVNIKLDNYPYTEYGIIYGEINSISAIPRDNTYSIKVNLNQGLKTSFNKILPFKQQLVGNAEIITTDLSIFDRLFFQIRSIFMPH